MGLIFKYHMSHTTKQWKYTNIQILYHSERSSIFSIIIVGWYRQFKMSQKFNACNMYVYLSIRYRSYFIHLHEIFIIELPAATSTT